MYHFIILLAVYLHQSSHFSSALSIFINHKLVKSSFGALNFGQQKEKNREKYTLMVMDLVNIFFTLHSDIFFPDHVCTATILTTSRTLHKKILASISLKIKKNLHLF